MRICYSTASTFAEAASIVTPSASRAIGANPHPRINGERHPKQRLRVGKLELWGHHTNDGRGPAIHKNPAPQDIGLATEVPLPHRVTEHDTDPAEGLPQSRGKFDRKKLGTKHVEDWRVNSIPIETQWVVGFDDNRGRES